MKRMIHGYTARSLSLTLLILILSQSGCSRDEKASFTPLKTGVSAQQLVQDLEREIPVLMGKAMIPGLSIAVIRDGAILWSKGFGVKNTETREPVTEETVYEACSLSKPVFAYAVMKCIERKMFDLDTPLVHYVPEETINKNFLGSPVKDERFRKITARRVLTHSSGFPNWRGTSGLTIQFEPGEKFSYSGEGFGYLQMVVEHLSGLSLEDFMKREVFDPLGMKNSSYVWQKDFKKSAARPHGMMGDVRKKGEPPLRGHAAASLHTTASDFAGFMTAFMNAGDLSKSMIDSMLTPWIVVSPEESENILWGLGVGLEKTPDGIAFWHWGDNENFRCFMIGFPEQKTGVVYFTNSFYGLTIRKKIVELAVGGSHPVLSGSMLADYGDPDSHAMTFMHTLVHAGVDSAVSKYQELAAVHTAAEIVPENMMNSIGYEFLRRQKIREAIEIFELNVKAYPDSWNVYDSLGEAYMKNGNREPAIEYYEKSLKMNPDNANGKNKLEELKNDPAYIIKKTADLLEENYVFPEAGKKCGQSLEKRLNAGAYRELKDMKALAEALTKDILNETKDKHNRVRVIEPSDMGEKTESPFHQPLRLYRLMQNEHYGFFRLQWFEGNVGYLDFRRFSALSCGKELMDSAMRFLKGTYAVIIDLRENQGGSGDMIQYLSSYFFSHPTQLVGLYSRTEKMTTESWTFEKVGGSRMTDVPLFILTGPNAFSAAETFAYDMKTRKRAVLVGEPTKGGAHDVELFNINEHLEIYISTGRAVSPVTGGNWEGKGVLPDVSVPTGTALDTALVLARKAAEAYGDIKEQTLRKETDSMQADLERAEELFRNGKDEQAEKVLNHFFSTGEHVGFNNTFLINVLAMGYFSPMNEKMLIALLKKNIEYHPDSSEACEILAYAYDKLGKMELARHFYEKTLEMNPLNGYAKERLKQM